MINLIIIWVLYYLLHSILAAQGVKSAVTAKTVMSDQVYRLLYVVLSALLFIAILFYTATLNHHYLWGSMISKFFGLMLATYGIFITRAAFRNYNTRAFLGLTNPGKENEKLITDGLQKHIRHPLYAGTILLFLGFFFYMPTMENLAVVVVSLLYVFIGIKIEEKKLAKTFGQEYENYKRNVPMLVPRFKK